MSIDFVIESLTNRAQSIQKQISPLEANNDLARLKHNLNEACKTLNVKSSNKPLVVALIGGTGVGKSYVFERLCKTKLGLSSSSTRAYTQKLNIACSLKDRPILPVSEDQLNFVESIISNIILIDTPDCDTINQSNAVLAKQSVSLADIVVYITTPDKRANFDIHEFIKEWAKKKRWFFAMNKADTVPEVSVNELRQDFLRHIKELGFEKCEPAPFVFSANNKSDTEFARLESTIYSERTAEQNKCFREQGIIMAFKNYTDNSQVEAIKKLEAELKTKREALNSKLKGEKEKLDENCDIKNMLKSISYVALLNELCNRSLGFYKPVFALKQYFTKVEKQQSRLERKIEAELITNDEVKNCFVDERRFLEDRNLISNASKTAAEEHKQQSKSIAQEISGVISQPKQEKSIIGAFSVFLANLLPAAVCAYMLIFVGYFMYLPGKCLFSKNPSLSDSFNEALKFMAQIPSSNFLVYGLFVMLVLMIPGYWFLNNKLCEQSSDAPRAMGCPQSFNRLASAQEQVSKILKETEALNEFAADEYAKLQKLLPESAFGQSANVC